MSKNGNQNANPALARAALYASVFRPVAAEYKSTGLRSNPLRFRALESIESRIAEDFLLNSRLRRNDRETELSIRSYFSDASMVMLSMIGQEEKPGIKSVDLPKSVPLRMDFGETIGWRRTVRNYTGDPMPLNHLATLVRCATGITAHAEVDLNDGSQTVLRLRAAPSAGGLYPIDLHMASIGVEDLDRGLYHYDPISDKLWRTGGEEHLDDLLASIDVPDEVIAMQRANLVFLLIGRPWRSMRKYGNRGMRYLFLEAGAISQNINLAVVALGYGSVDCGSIYDDEAHEAMQLDGTHQSLIHSIVVGAPG